MPLPDAAPAAGEWRVEGDAVGLALRHRAPFLFIDHAEIEADATRVRGTHRFDPGESFFAGHFPDDPIVPGVILLELVAQAANLLLSHRAGRRVSGQLVGVEEARFNRPVRPGQSVTVDVRLARAPGPGGGALADAIVGFRATGFVEGQRCLRASVGIHQGGGAPPAA